MKKWFPYIVTGVFALWLAFSMVPPKDEGPYHVQDFGRLPVLLNGRIQPIDSVAKNSLLIIRGKRSVRLEDGETLSASQWLLETATESEKADDRKVFRVDHPELKAMLHVPEEEKHFSFNQIRPHWEDLRKEAARVSEIETAVRTPFEKQVAKLSHGMGIYMGLKHSLRMEGRDDFEEEIANFEAALGPGLEAVQKNQAGEEFDTEALSKLAGYFKQYELWAPLAYPLVIPPADPQEDPNAWKKIGVALMEALRSGEVHPAVEYYAAMGDAYREDQPERFNQALASYRGWLDENMQEELAKGKKEFFYNRFEPFYKSSVIYVLAFLLACASWFNWSRPLNRSAFYLIFLALTVHTAGLIFRMVLEGRPPVTNLYSSAVFVGWGAVILGLILERIYKDGIGSVVASAVGFVTLVIAHNLALGGDTMEMLRAVLDTNFWLATHVVVITLGYSSVFVSGFLAIVYVLRGIFTKTLSSVTAKSLVRMIYGIVCFSTLFSFLGTVLGGIWADQSWGRFWGWDPKENGALIIVIWCAIILHARWGGMIRDRGLVASAIFGNVVTAFSWFGVNMLGVGLHSYGFMDEAFRWLMLFVVSQLALIGLAFLPLKYWKSAPALRAAPSSNVKPTSASKPGRKRPETANA